MSLEKKVIQTAVRITTEKFCKVGQYIMAITTPQWNMSELSKFDYDTLSPVITDDTIVKEKDDYAYSPLPTY
jgi:hypothetical protein